MKHVFYFEVYRLFHLIHPLVLMYCQFTPLVTTVTDIGARRTALDLISDVLQYLM